MSGMNSGINVNDPTVIAAFKSALVHQGIIALLIFALLGFARPARPPPRPARPRRRPWPPRWPRPPEHGRSR